MYNNTYIIIEEKQGENWKKSSRQWLDRAATINYNWPRPASNKTPRGMWCIGARIRKSKQGFSYICLIYLFIYFRLAILFMSKSI